MAENDSLSKILKGLNPEQKKAVCHGPGPLMIVAGAGTGKTTVITRRIAWLVLSGLAKTDEILALTFTEKAAQEMEERADKLLPYGYVDLWISTFHSFCERILQEHALDIGLPLNFKLLNETQQCFLIQENFNQFNLDYYRPLGNPTRFIQSLVKHFSRAKDELISPEDYLEYVENLKTNEDMTMSGGQLTQEISRLKELAEAYHVYQQLLLKNNALDFGDLINYTLRLFEKRPQILGKYKNQFKYILVDEFQDTNWAQYKLLQTLTKANDNLTVVLDDDQAIYLWRGASYNNALQFKKDYPKAKQIVLVSNYRSCQNILDLAYNFIQQNNPERLEAQEKEMVKKLKAKNQGEGEIVHWRVKDQEEEARIVVEKIIDLKKRDQEASWNDFAVLVRANSQAEIFVQALNMANVPHQFLARSGLFSKSIILDILSYLKLLDNYHESPAIYRVLISPIFQNKIKGEDLANLTNFAYKKSWSLYEAMQKASIIPKLSSSTIGQLNIFLSLIQKHTELSKSENVSKVIYAFLEDSGYLKILAKQEDRSEKKNREKVFWLNQFFKKVENFEAVNFDKSINNFNRMMDLMISTGDTGSMDSGLEEGPEAVKVSTVHSIKGLEFKYVFIVNLVDKRFPTIERHEAIELPKELIKEIIPQGDIHLQEERRLFYVALTRAKYGLYLTSAEDYGGKTVKKPSRFLYEISLINEKETEKRNKKEILAKPLDEFQKEKPTVLPARFSFSQLIAFDTCPLQYKFAFILNIPRKGRYVFSFGKSLHKTLYQFSQIWRENQKTKQKNLFDKKTGKEKILPFEYLLKIYEQCWIDEWYQNKEHQEKYKEKGKQVLKMFYEDLFNTNPKIRYLEKEFNFKIGGYIIKGFIDRVDENNGGLEIIDYKTGQGGSKNLDLEKKQQLYIYQLAAQKLPTAFNKPIQQLTFYYLETGEKVSFLGKEEDLKKIEEKIIKTINKIKQGDFSPRPSRLCRFCDFFPICQYRQE
jgi:DNA helicase-2/ATP-dependent DNA helicase PcrA